MTTFAVGHRVIVTNIDDYLNTDDSAEFIGYYGHIATITGRPEAPYYWVTLQGRAAGPTSPKVMTNNPWPFMHHELQHAD